ncbi:MAG: FG-GAP-like repeat-containing protein [Janthinobacterium lividum]
MSTSVVDANGDVVVVGNFQGDITFGTLPTLTAGSFSDVYVAKLNGQTRQWLWAVRAGGNGPDARVSPARVVIDGAGDIVLAGSYTAAASFAGLPTLVASRSYTSRALVAKLSGSTGSWLWAVGSAGFSSFGTAATSLALDAAGNAVVGGYFGETAQFGSLPAVTATSVPYASDAYVAGIAASTGQWQWVKPIPALTSAAVADVAIDAAGNVALAGYYQGALTLGSLPTLPGGSAQNLFVAKLAPPTGQWLWAARAAGTTSASGASFATALKISPAGDLVVAGSLGSGAFQFGGLAAVAGSATYLAKLTGSGTWQWVQSSSSSSGYTTITFDAAGSILAAGTFTNTAQFGPATTLTSRGKQDIFVSKTDASSGQVLWATRAGGTGPELVHALATTGAGDILLTGTFQNQTNFGSLPTVAGSASAAGVASTYLARLSSSPFAVVDFTPARHAGAAAVAGLVEVVYNKPLATAGTPAIRVFGDQRQGYKPGASSQQSASGLTNNALRFTPAAPFSPNELVSVTVGSVAASTGGTPASAWVYQFRAAVGGPGRGLFSGTATSAGAWQSALLIKGDVDNDGDLDFISAGLGGSAFTAGLNDGTGQFAAGPGFAVRGAITAVALADVDADGDLDITWAAHYATTDSVLFKLNNGSGSFGGLTKVAVEAAPRSLAFGDLDADGDLDLVVASYQAAGKVSVRLNDGAGHFSGTTAVSTGATTYGVALGDLDSDGDLDLLATNEGDGTILVALNNGAGSFGPAAATPAGTLPHEAILVDIDQDSDLDFVASSAQAGATSVLIGTNRGTGNFAISTVAVGPNSGFSLADIDADEDADLLVFDQAGHTVRTWLNNGAGLFNRAQITTLGPAPSALMLADLDGDGDIDWLTTNGDGTLSPRFNTGVALATQSSQAPAAVAIYPNPAHQLLTILLPAGTGPTQLVLTNSLGQAVMHRAAISPAPDGSIQLPLSDIATGMYHLRILANGVNVSKALVIE